MATLPPPLSFRNINFAATLVNKLPQSDPAVIEQLTDYYQKKSGMENIKLTLTERQIGADKRINVGISKEGDSDEDSYNRNYGLSFMEMSFDDLVRNIDHHYSNYVEERD